MSEIASIINVSANDQKNIFGNFDEYLKKIERTFHVSVIARESEIKIVGTAQSVNRTRNVLKQLIALSEEGADVTEQSVDYALFAGVDEGESLLADLDREIICRTAFGKPVKPKTLGQKHYVDRIRDKMIVFGIGPAGTGKTYLAMAMAVNALKDGSVGRLILTRPAIEAGENLGFLPGDLQSKVDPYLRPLYDALYQLMGADAYLRESERGVIEVAPLAYMRGRTLDNAFIILDEAQNTTPAQMKMFLTRIGFGSKVIVTGDRTQKDLPRNVVSGLDVAIKVLSGIEDIAFVYLDSRDVVRHPLVQKIVRAYEDYDKKSQRGHKA